MTRHNRIAALALAAFVAASVSVAVAESHVRIVRLSYVNGQVKVDRGAGQGLERAILNTPIVEGAKLVTGDDGLAEVEFEDQSTLRLTGNTELQFRQLLVNDAGQKVNEIALDKGVAYLDARAKKDIYRVMADGASLLVTGDAQVRLTASPDQLRVAVTKGDVQMVSLPQTVTVAKKETLVLDPKDPSAFKIDHSVTDEPEDAWNKERMAYASAYASSQGVGPSHAYGLQDLNYYGDFFYAGGYGYVWQPFGFADSLYAWSPYSNGAWMFSPGMGYGWTSAYPWGWLPYHYGSWAFLSNAGWVWVPGGGYRGTSWYANGFQSVPIIKKAPANWTAPQAPTVAANATHSTVIVGSTHAAGIAGGRVAPDFASVIARRGVSPTASKTAFVRPGSDARLGSHDVHATAVHPAHGHVFASPARASAMSVDAPVGPAAVRGGRAVGPPPTMPIPREDRAEPPRQDQADPITKRQFRNCEAEGGHGGRLSV